MQTGSGEQGVKTMAFTELQNSSYLDLTSYRGNAPLPASTGSNG